MSQTEEKQGDGGGDSCPTIQLVRNKHKKYLSRMLKVLPECLSSMETTRMTLVYFTISALDVLNELDEVLIEEEKASIIEWIYSLQVQSIVTLRLLPSKRPVNPFFKKFLV